jgi:Flp pilus assembly protein TadG
MNIVRDFKSILQRFWRSQSGVVVAEAVIVLPLLLWAYLALFVYWDAFKSVNTSQKAAYTISDAISRETQTLPANYVTGLRNLMRFMLKNNQGVKLRVSEVTWSQINNRFEVDWSRSPDNAIALLTTTAANQIDYAGRIPKMSDADRVIIVETEVAYHPAFNAGVTDKTLKQFIVTRLRFTPKLCMTGTVCP